MSLLRVTVAAKCLRLKVFLGRTQVLVEGRGRCVWIRTAAERRISETASQRQRSKISFSLKRTDDPTRRVQEQTQLLDVLEARIHQLQSDTVLDVQQTNVQLVRAHSSAGGLPSGGSPSGGAPSGGAPRSSPPKNAGVSKSVRTAGKDSSKAKHSNWLEKLSNEKRDAQERLKKSISQTKREAEVQHAAHKKKPQLPGPSLKTVSSKTAPSAKKSKKKLKPPDPIPAVVPAAETSTTQHKTSTKLHKTSTTQKKTSSKRNPTTSPAAETSTTQHKTSTKLHKTSTTQKKTSSKRNPTTSPAAETSTTQQRTSTTQQKTSTTQQETSTTQQETSTTQQETSSKKNPKDSKNPSSAEQPKKKKPRVAVSPQDLHELQELQRSLGGPETLLLPSCESGHNAGQGTTFLEVQSNFRSFMEGCICLGDVQRASDFLMAKHGSLHQRKYLDTSMFNIMMKVQAKRGSFYHVGHLFNLVKEVGLKPDLDSYSAALECMGRNPHTSEKVISGCLSRMEQDGLSLDNLFNSCVFAEDEREMVMKAVLVVRPDYKPSTSSRHPPPSLIQDFYSRRDNHQYPKLIFTPAELQERFQQQLELEKSCTVTIDSVEACKEVTDNMRKMRELLAQQKVQWQEVLLKAFKESKSLLTKPRNSAHSLSLYPYLFLLEDQDYVDIMVQGINSVPANGETLKYLVELLGDQVYTKYYARQKHQSQIVDKMKVIYDKYVEQLSSDTETCNNLLPRELWRRLETELSSGPSLQLGLSRWSTINMVHVGTHLMELMVKNLKIDGDILNPNYEKKPIPILYHMYAFRSLRKVGFIKPHPILTQIQQRAMETKLTFDSHAMPMLCPPLPWVSVKFGGHLLTPTKIMRTSDGATQHQHLLEKCQNLDPVLDSLNQLGNCAWKVNKVILDIVISVFNDRGSEELDIPPPMSEAPKIPQFNANYDLGKSQFKKDLMVARKKCGEMYSQRMSELFKLSIANHVRDEVFWFPHNMDFRGRTYPCPPYFNHLGSDISRAILLFAEGKPLGPKGLDWLKIHLINLTGLQKRNSLQGRLDYANTVMEDILDSADKPLDGRKWWMQADEQWQALACCMEIANATRSPDPEKFVSHFPVHQDGSCNGLQHYAALGRDVVGAASVNLVDSELPMDVYSEVAQQVERSRARSAQQGLKIAQVLEGFITRKVVKQTVMTVVYGVTRFGGRLQIEKRLKEINEFPKESVWEASSYLARGVFSSLSSMFKGSREIQDWLTLSAKNISMSGHSVEWVTPLGLPVIQPYHRMLKKVRTCDMQSLTFSISYDATQRPDVLKQKNAFPPNFIHSLDSTHMMLTALHCYSHGLTFVSVHDCFWTHAVTVDTMNQMCREQFVVLHSQPILEDLSRNLILKFCTGLPSNVSKKNFKGYRDLLLLLSNVPQKGDFDLDLVKQSKYFFS